ncbi:phosphate ABC transporter ATP-binding protein [Ferrimonas aestuarii]|uniref:Phosphate ABC transporter ATP-binding protein n=2 Tax=Ferrimonas aestuarii TaxID=2569539 RepID=A0A4V5NWL2_9GAMM|nr:phosphate ABC transporter ATP-binding protein [Ferrimonas aestuarii]TKB58388.1 phosphate ABC transporter ATP-binding protein [Ferrimonas aestuarii]
MSHCPQGASCKSSRIATIRNLSVQFNGRTALDDINLMLEKHKVAVVSGHSGCGKSTLLKALNRLNDSDGNCHTQGDIELMLSSGPVLVNRLPQQGLPQLRQRVGMVFQHPQLLPGSIEDNLLLPLKVVKGLSEAAARAKIRRACEQASLWEEIGDRLTLSADSLSGGQQQRLCLARTLAMEPELLLLDEPTASLDPKAAARIEQCISQLAAQYSIVMVSHSEAQVEALADVHIQMQSGRIVGIS